MVTTLTYHQIERIEVNFCPDSSDPRYSYLQLSVYPKGASRPDKLSFFPSTTQAADHLHNIFLACQLMLDPPGPASSEEAVT
jgi:hypothetical protein